MQRKILFLSIVSLVIASCASKKDTTTTAEAKKQIEDIFNPKIGSATKQDLISDFGNPEWCKQEDSGGETCRFYRKKGTKWIGEEGRDKKSITKYDQVIADFDSNGTLKSFKASALR